MKAVLLLAVVSVVVDAQAQGPVFTTLYEFKGGADGSMGGNATNGGRANGVTLGKNGRLYGTTYAGGSNTCGINQCGTVYELTPASGTPWTKTILYSFHGSDGAQPDANLILGSNGAFYSTTLGGGTVGQGGTVFELAPPATPGGTWTETVLYSFSNGWN